MMSPTATSTAEPSVIPTTIPPTETGTAVLTATASATQEPTTTPVTATTTPVSTIDIDEEIGGSVSVQLEYLGQSFGGDITACEFGVSLVATDGSGT